MGHTIQEAKALGDKEKAIIVGRFKSISDEESLKGGQYVVRRLILEDDTGDIKGTWWEPPSNAKSFLGEIVKIDASIREETYKGRESKKFNCSGSEAVQAQAPKAAAASDHGGSVSGLLTLDQYLNVADIVVLRAGSWGITEQPALAAVVNTALIALSNGRIEIPEELLEKIEEEPPDSIAAADPTSNDDIPF